MITFYEILFLTVKITRDFAQRISLNLCKESNLNYVLSSLKFRPYSYKFENENIAFWGEHEYFKINNLNKQHPQSPISSHDINLEKQTKCKLCSNSGFKGNVLLQKFINTKPFVYKDYLALLKIFTNERKIFTKHFLKRLLAKFSTIYS